MGYNIYIYLLICMENAKKLIPVQWFKLCRPDGQE